jgi:hypothetical protein
MLEWSCFFCLFGLAWLCWQLARMSLPVCQYRLALTPVLPQLSPGAYIDQGMPIPEQIIVALALQAARRLGCPPNVTQTLIYRNDAGQDVCLCMLGVN